MIYGMWLIVEILFSLTKNRERRGEGGRLREVEGSIECAMRMNRFVRVPMRLILAVKLWAHTLAMRNITAPTENASIYGFHMILNLNLCTFKRYRLQCVRSSSR